MVVQWFALVSHNKKVVGLYSILKRLQMSSKQAQVLLENPLLHVVSISIFRILNL